MKTIPIASHYALSQTSLCRCLRLDVLDPLQTDPITYGLTTLNRALVVDGVEYRPGLDVSDLVSQSGTQVDNLDLTILPDDDELIVADLIAGRWDNAKVTIFEVNFRNPGAGINVLKRGSTGTAKANRSSWVIEFRSLKQALQSSVTIITQKTCRYRLGSVAMPDGLCFVDLSGFQVSSTVSGATSNRQFTDDSLTNEDGYFQEGEVLFVTGANAGYSRKVKSFVAEEFLMASPFPFAIANGDAYIATAGCQKRWDVDCRDKFDNILNFGGEKDLAGIDGLTADPEVG